MQRSGHVIVTLPRPLEPGEATSVALTYAGNPGPTRSVWGEVGWEELDDGVLVASQPTGAPTWFPCNDHPRSKATYRIAVECDSPYAVCVTGTLTGRYVRGSRTRHVYDQPHPMATYLAAVHVGQYERPCSPRRPCVRSSSPRPGCTGRCWASCGSSREMMELFVDLFGPYPFDDYTVVVTPDELEIPLEAQGMATFGPNWLSGRGVHQRLIAHELAHQWFGNSLTVTSWADIWLNEGFACYAEWLWSQASGGPSADTLASQQRTRLAGLAQDFVLADPGPETMFDDRVYKRGALTLHALRLHLGDEGFGRCCSPGSSEHEHGSVSTADFVQHVASHRPIGRGRAAARGVAHAPRPPAAAAPGPALISARVLAQGCTVTRTSP